MEFHCHLHFGEVFLKDSTDIFTAWKKSTFLSLEADCRRIMLEFMKYYVGIHEVHIMLDSWRIPIEFTDGFSYGIEVLRRFKHKAKYVYRSLTRFINWPCPRTTDTWKVNPKLFAAQIQIQIPDKYLGCGYKGLVFCRNNGWILWKTWTRDSQYQNGGW